MTNLNDGNSLPEPRPVFVDADIQVFEGSAAAERLHKRNDLQYLTQEGILQVDSARWLEAQRYERKTWMTNLANADDDRNHDHENNFGGYQAVAGRTFHRVIELGCGPFTNLRLVLPHIQAEHITLLDPLIKDYLNHPHCTYRNGNLLGIPVETVASSIEEFKPAEPYDLLVMANVLEHCYDVPAIFQRILQCLKPGGVLVFGDNVFRQEHLPGLLANQFDAGHPIRVTEPLITKFLQENFSELYHQRFYGGYDQPHRIDVYFIGTRRPQIKAPAARSQPEGSRDKPRPRIHFVYSGDPRNDAAVGAPATITNRVFRFLEQRSEVLFYDLEDTTTVPDVRPGDLVLGHPHPGAGTMIRRLMKMQCAGKHLLFPFHSRLPEINRFALEIAADAQKLFLISGPYWTENLGQTEFAAWQNKIVRLDNSIDLEFFKLRKKTFNPAARRGMFVLGRSGPEKGTTELFQQLREVPGRLLVAGNYTAADLAILQGRPETQFLGMLDWRNEALIQRIVAACDFFINYSVSDASPTTLFETMALGLIPVTTPQCGYTYPSLIPLSLTDTESNLVTLRNLQLLPDEQLAALQARNRSLVEQNHNWPRFLAALWEGMTGEQPTGRTAGADPAGREKTPPPVRAGLGKPKVAEDFCQRGKDFTSVQNNSEFEHMLRQIIRQTKPGFIVETGTYLGQGTTRIISSALRENGLMQTKFYSVECNPEHHRQALDNLGKAGLLPFVKPLLGVSVPRSLLPDAQAIREATIENASGEIFVDHHEENRIQLYLSETDHPELPDDLLGQCLRECDGRPGLLLLDSAGHMGNVEFNYVLKLLRGPTYIALDDIRHVKHARSVEQMKADPRFQMLAITEEKFGSCLLKFNPGPRETFPPLERARRVLFVRTDSIGDAVLASAMLEPLRRRYPNARLAVLCQQPVAELLAACPLVDSIICYDHKKMDDAAERAQILAEITAFQPDVILNSVRSRDRLSNELTLAFRAAPHIAIEGDHDNISAADHAKSAAAYEFLIPSPGEHKPEAERHADFLRGLGIETLELKPVVWTSAEDEALAEEFFRQQKLDPQRTLALFPFTQHAIKDYPDIAGALAEFAGWNFLIFGGRETQERCELLATRLKGTIFNLAGRTSLREMAALIRRCKILVGSDSCGPHIACALGVPNVVLLGGGHFGRFMPYSPLTSAVALPLHCFGCDWRCQFQRAHCIKDIAVNVLAEAIQQTLQKNADRPRLFLQMPVTGCATTGQPQWQRPDAWLAGMDVEIIEVRVPFPGPAPVPAPPPQENHQRVACPACGSTRGQPVRKRADIVRCTDCQMVYLRTRLTKDAMRKLYQTYADDGSHMALPKTRAEAERSGLAREYFQQEILQFIAPGGGWLDVGCGWGGFLLNARSKGFTPRGIELTRKCVAYANQELGIPVVDTQLEDTDITPGSLSVVTMNHVFEHLPEPRRALKKVLDSLKPGGVFCGMVPNFSSACSEVLGEEWYWLDPNYHYTHFTPPTLRQLLEAAGFIVEKIYTDTGDYGADTVRKACLTRDPKLANDDYFAAELKRFESEGRGEEIRFFARKSARLEPEKTVEAPAEALLLIPEIPAGPEPVVSVIVSTYASEKFIRACLENLTHQTIFDQCEIIVVDSGSPENERAIVAEFQQKFSNIRYLRTPRETIYGAWNRGLALARGRYWANANTDDSLRNDALKILTAALDKHADCALAYADTAWTTKPNDTFPSAHVVQTVKYPDYAPIETLFYCLTGCLQFFRTESLRQLGGFDAALHCAGDYEATLKMMAARMNAVHVPEVLSLFFQNAAGLTQTSNRAAIEHNQVMDRYRNQLDIANIFQTDPASRSATADALAMLGTHATKFSVPWENQPMEHNDYAFACFNAALRLDPENEAAGMSLLALCQKQNSLNSSEAELIQRWPKMREWIANFRVGERLLLPRLNHARLGPVYRPAEWAHRPTGAQLAREPKALRPWITRIEGRHVYLSEDLFPRPAGLRLQPEELQLGAKRLAALLAALPPFYAHFGGAGDALLLLASFYDQKPDGIIFSHPNGIGAAKALFDAFPKLSKIYFLPQHAEPYFHIVQRYFVYELRNCLGAGTTPKDNYDEEWNARLDIEKKYRVHKTPRWAAAWRQNENSKRVALAPKGSLTGMVGSKRNLILPELWPQVIAHILARGFEPVILGVPAEAKDYPALPGCADARGESFAGQMKVIGQCAGLVGADSWAKTFSALAEIPTLVFEPIKGADIAAWKDPSDWVFIEPWPSIKMLRSLDEFRRSFDSRIAKIPGLEPQKNSRPIVAWEGSFLDYGSLSHINRELTSRLSPMLAVSCVGPNILSRRAKTDSEMQRCAQKLLAKAPAETAVTVRHQWPPNWSPPESGALVVIQPWEYGVLPKAWVEQSANVDEFWVPSPLVRHMYLDSGIAPEKVRVVPNGVDAKKFRPGVKPLALKTRKKFKFLFVGGTIFRKGPDILLEAFSKTFTAADDVCLVIKDFGGDSFYQGQTAEAAIRAIQQNPSAPEILYLKDELSSEQMPALYAACDCFVLPYRGEGFGMPVLEAMACGLPVIVTAGGATESFVGSDAGWKIPSRAVRLSDRVGDIQLVKNGWLLEPSKTHFGAILKIAASRPDECRERGARGRGIVEKKFDWNDIAASVAHRLKELAERAPVKIQPCRANLPVSPTKPMVQPAVAKLGRLAEARELLAQKKLQAAWESARIAMVKRPFHPEALLLLAEIALAAGDGKVARLCAQQARDLAPGWPAPKQFLTKPLKGDAKLDWLQPEAVSNLKAQIANRLSVCLIAKNEEKFLAQCLKSVRGLAAQIIVVDTGSTDRTVAIAREFGAEIYSFAWGDDFAAARNAALERATGDWVLMLDADEELPSAQHAALLADLKKSGVLAHRLPLANAGQNDGRSFVPRLFRNAPGVYYSGRIHEQVFPSLLPHCKQWGLKTALGTAEILHHGYTREMVRDRNKIERNLKLLRLALEENPADVNLVMNLGLELVRSDDLAGGVEKYREAFQMMSAQPAGDLVPELREVLLTQFTSQLYKIRAHAEVVEVLLSPLARQGGLTASLHLALGLAQFELKQFSEAADQMRQCLAKRKQPALSPINTDIHTAAPQHCLALSRAKLGDLAGAEKTFQLALAEPGGGENLRLDFAKFLAAQNRFVEALGKLHEIIAPNPRQAAAWRLGGEITLSRPELLEFAREWTGEAVRALPDDSVLAGQHADALLLNGDTPAALELWEKIWDRDRSARTLAALILCEAVEAPTTHAPDDGADELAASRAFIEWYQKLIAVRASALTVRINEQLDKLSRALPTAARMLESALQEAETPAEARAESGI